MIELNLQHIASRLEGLEETIIHKLIDRAQWCVNDIVYAPGQSGFTNENSRSLFELRLFYQEEMDAKFGRFCVPEERPFNSDLPAPSRAVNIPDTGLRIGDYNVINLTSTIISNYRELLRKICPAGDDGQYGSSAEHDVYAVQAIARRIHYGALYVAESKYRGDVDGYRKLINANDTSAIMEKLTRKEVEDKIIARVKDKVEMIQGNVNRSVRNAVDPEVIVTFYRDFVIPMTKEGEVLYLMDRMDE